MLLLLLFAHPAAASRSCGGPTAQEELRRSEAVFVGRALGNSPSLLHPLSETVTTFEVQRRWKGAPSRYVEVVTDGWRIPFTRTTDQFGLGDFGGFERDSSYVVFAAWHRNALRANEACGSNTIPTTCPDPRIQALIDSTIRSLGPSMPPGPAPSRAGQWIALVGGGGLLLGLWRWYRRARMRVGRSP